MKKFHFFIIIISFLILNSCNSYGLQGVKLFPGMDNTTSPEIANFSSPATENPPLTPEPRWLIYEKSLAEAIIPGSESICEWVILGVQKQEIFVYAICRDIRSFGTASVPAVIYLNDEQEIVKIRLPGSGNQYSENIQNLFPSDIQEIILTGKGMDFDESKAEKHLDMRILDSSLPPLIALEGTTLP